MLATPCFSQPKHSSSQTVSEEPTNLTSSFKMSCDSTVNMCDSNSIKNEFSTISSSNVITGKHLISFKSLVINKELGAGEFGTVQQGVWTDDETGERIQVAIKCLSKQRMQNNYIEFLKEAAIMHSLDHEHIFRLYGVVIDHENAMLVTELAPLRSLLECLREPSLKSSFPIISLCEFTSQIADGMCYLESKRLIHRDLAARNILVFTRNKIKISDFGLSRALGVGKDYYQTNFNVNLKLPIAWCAPECINFLKFTSASDVWAYGVTLWEMFSYGFQPWAALTGQQILQSIDKPKHQRLEQPDSCPKEYYLLMLKCWQHDPAERPHFHEIVKMLPDCRPELVQVVKNCPTDVDCHKDHLSYRVGDIITVLEKCNQRHASPKLNGSCDVDDSARSVDDRLLWKGSLVSGKIGLFDPSNTVTHLGSLFPTPAVPTASVNSIASLSSHSTATTSSPCPHGHSSGTLSHSNHHGSSLTLSSNPLSANFLRGIVEKISTSSLASGIYSSKRGKLKRDMISMPQPDFKHTGHVGVDGAFFGDVSFLAGKYDKFHYRQEKTSHMCPPVALNKDVLGQKPSHAFEHEKTLDSHKHQPSHSVISTGSSLKDSKIKPENIVTKPVGDHEYHEIVNDFYNDDLLYLESPNFEAIDLGPSLLDEVCRELDFIFKPADCDLSDNQQDLINESCTNVKNEIKEITTTLPLIRKESKKKQATVKPISADDEESLNSAIAIAKELASRSILECDSRLENTTIDSSSDSPNSPNKKSSKFPFKFHSKSSPKTEKRSFSKAVDKINSLQCLISREAEEAYSTLIEKKSSKNNSPSNSSSLINITSTINGNDCKSQCSPVIAAPTQSCFTPSNVKPVATVIANSSSIGQLGSARISPPTATKLPSCVQQNRPEVTSCDHGNQGESNDSNPLKMLRTNGVGCFFKVRGNKQRVSSNLSGTSFVARSSLGTPPPVPTVVPTSPSNNQSNVTDDSNESIDYITISDQGGHLANALPLPPRHRPTGLKIPIKHHQRKHPLLLTCSSSPDSPDVVTLKSVNSPAQSRNMPVLSTFRPPPIVKQTSCPESSDDRIFRVKNNSNQINVKSTVTAINGSSKNHLTRMSFPPPPKPVRDPSTVLSSVEHSSSESIESQVTKEIKSLDRNDCNSSRATTDESKVMKSKNETTPNESENNKVNCIDVTDNKDNNSENNMNDSSNEHKSDDLVRVMQQVLASEVTVSTEECVHLLSRTDWDVHRAIKCVRLKQILLSHKVDISQHDWIEKLKQFNWNVRQVSNYLIATHVSPDDTTEV